MPPQNPRRATALPLTPIRASRATGNPVPAQPPSPLPAPAAPPPTSRIHWESARLATLWAVVGLLIAAIALYPTWASWALAQESASAADWANAVAYRADCQSREVSTYFPVKRHRVWREGRGGSVYRCLLTLRQDASLALDPNCVAALEATVEPPPGVWGVLRKTAGLGARSALRYLRRLSRRSRATRAGGWRDDVFLIIVFWLPAGLLSASLAKRRGGPSGWGSILMWFLFLVFLEPGLDEVEDGGLGKVRLFFPCTGYFCLALCDSRRSVYGEGGGGTWGRGRGRGRVMVVVGGMLVGIWGCWVLGWSVVWFFVM